MRLDMKILCIDNATMASERLQSAVAAVKTPQKHIEVTFIKLQLQTTHPSNVPPAQTRAQLVGFNTGVTMVPPVSTGVTPIIAQRLGTPNGRDGAIVSPDTGTSNINYLYAVRYAGGVRDNLFDISGEKDDILNQPSHKLSTIPEPGSDLGGGDGGGDGYSDDDDDDESLDGMGPKPKLGSAGWHNPADGVRLRRRN